MKQPILIAVGGTGQNVLAAYLRLAAMAGFTPAPFFVLDSDSRGPQHEGLAELKKTVTTVVGGQMPRRWQVNPYPTDQVGQQTFGELMAPRGDAARAVFESLFSEEAEKTPIRDGMYGRPAIGASCMSLKLLRNDDDLREMKEALKGGEKHVVLVGSCFGGTGSGGVPILAREFERLNGEPGFKLRVQAVVFLPWFRLELPPGEASEGERALHQRLNANFDPNAAASIRFFQAELRERLESLIFLGFHDPSLVARQSRESKQDEVIHPLNLLAAVLVHGLFTDGVTAPGGVSGYWYDGEKGFDAAALRLPREGKPNISLTAAVRRCALREKWLSILRHFFTVFHDLPRLSRPALIEVALERVRVRQAKPSEVAGEIADHLDTLVRICRENLKWIDRLSANDLLPLQAEDKRIQALEYQAMCDDPLPVIAEFCSRDAVIASFEARDLAKPTAFAATFSEQFLADLGDQFQL